MELPIFRELESVWFRTNRARPPRSDGEAAPAAPAAPSAPAAPAVQADETNRFAAVSTGTLPARERAEPAAAPVTAASSSGRGADEWQTAADDGWRAASTAAQAPVDEVTPAGLPKRRPMAQLVPGGVSARDQATDTGAGGQRRSPEAVRGLLSAYHRGVQRGRGQAGGADDGTSGSGGPQANQAGKEQK